MAVSCKRAAGILIGIIVYILPAGSVLAQEHTIYTLTELVDSARHHLPILLQKQALLSSAQAGIMEAKHAWLPKMNVVEELSIGSANDLAGPFLPAPGVLHAMAGGITGKNSYQSVAGNLASLYGEYELVDFGFRSARLANARAFADVRRADLTRELYMVEWQVGKAYFEIRKARYQLAVDEEDIRRNEAIYTISKALTGTGINAGVDSSLAKAGLSRAKISYNQAAANLRQLEQELSYLSGVADPLIEVDTTGAGISGTMGAVTPDAVGLRREIMAEGNPLEDYYIRQQEQQRTEAVMIGRSYLPRIVAGAGGWARGSSIQYNNDYRPLEEGLGYQRLNYVAGLGVTYDLFNGVRRKDKLAEANYQQAAAEYALQQQQLSLRNTALQADEAVRMAEKNLQELPVQMQAARDAYNQKIAQYKAGIINLVDLTNASFVLYQAQSDYVETLNGWHMAGLDKAAATGGLDQFIQSVK
ncbi:MAG TPA: TolC family protein [Puia sp.]|nr:TolC family protein [Puia sp.]